MFCLRWKESSEEERSRCRADPCHGLRRGIAGGIAGGIEDGHEAHHAVVRVAAASGADRHGGRIAAPSDGTGQRGDKVLPDLERGMDKRSFGGTVSFTSRPSLTGNA